MAYDSEGNLFFADSNNHIIRKIDTNGMVSTVAGTPPVNGLPQYGYEGDGGPATDDDRYTFEWSWTLTPESPGPDATPDTAGNS